MKLLKLVTGKCSHLRTTPKTFCLGESRAQSGTENVAQSCVMWMRPDCPECANSGQCGHVQRAAGHHFPREIKALKSLLRAQSTVLNCTLITKQNQGTEKCQKHHVLNKYLQHVFYNVFKSKDQSRFTLSGFILL